MSFSFEGIDPHKNYDWVDGIFYKDAGCGCCSETSKMSKKEALEKVNDMIETLQKSKVKIEAIIESICHCEDKV